MMAVAWRKHMTGSSGDVAMEGKMAGVVVGVQGMGGKRGSDCSTSSGLQLLRRFPQFNVRGSGRCVRSVITLAKINSALANCEHRWSWWGEEEGGKGTA
jgi:hypothetical protein